MAVEDIQSPFQLPASVSGFIPPELSSGFLSDLDASFRLQEKQQMEDLLGFQESRGLLKSGETNKRLVEDVLGPGLRRRREALTPLAMEGARFGLQERTQRESEERKFKRDLDYLERNATYQRELAILNAELQGQMFQNQKPSFGQTFQQSFASGFGGSLGKGMGGAGTDALKGLIPGI